MFQFGHVLTWRGSWFKVYIIPNRTMTQTQGWFGLWKNQFPWNWFSYFWCFKRCLVIHSVLVWGNELKLVISSKAFYLYFFLISAKLLVIPFHKIYRSSNKLQRAIFHDYNNTTVVSLRIASSTFSKLGDQIISTVTIIFPL